MAHEVCDKRRGAIEDPLRSGRVVTTKWLAVQSVVMDAMLYRIEGIEKVADWDVTKYVDPWWWT